MPPPAAAAPQRRTTSGDRKLSRGVEDEEVRPYVIVSDLGKGSFATVYRGYHEETRLEVAIKTVNRSGLTAKLLENLQGEIEILKTLSHRHITKLLDIVDAERNIYLIIEFCAGGDLSNYIKKRGRVEGLEYSPSPGAAPMYYPHPRTGGLDEIVVRSFLRQLARALKFLRHRNLIHRDIKPQNLLLNPAPPEELARGHPIGVPILKIADFGFARSLPQAMMAETLCGSPLYMAPEILHYEKYDAKADLWSVGAVLYEMAVGKPPFRAQNHIELIKKIDNSKGIKFPDEDPQLVARAQADGEELKPVPSDVKKLIRSLLKRIPAERCSFDDFFGSTALAKSKFPRPSRPAPPPPPPEEEDIGNSIPEHHKVIPPEVLDPKAMIPPSKFNFRRRDTGEGSREETLTNGNVADLRQPVTHPPSNDGSVIPGETDEDGLLRREYVLVDDRRAVEVNRTVDEINAARRRPLRDRRTPTIPLPSDPTQVQSPVTPPIDNQLGYQPTGSPLSAPISFPPAPNPNAPPLSSSPSSASSRAASNALTRALNLASKTLFGSTPRTSPYYRDYTQAASSSSPSSPRRPQIISASKGLGLDVDGKVTDPVEDKLLADLEELAQKTEVLTRWADEMYDYVKSIPQKPLPDPTKFTRREGEPERHAARRKNADIQAEYNAMTCVALYMLLMSFSQKGIDKLRNHNEHMQMRDPDGEMEVSEGFDEALNWFKDHFIKCHDRAGLVKTWLPAHYSGPPTFLDQLVYDRALSLSRTAARKELLDQARTPDECEKLYEESLWCLYALQDDLLQSDNPFMEEDRNTISTWIKRTKLRLVRCRVRMGMNDRDRLRDARLDKNLDDVQRDPPPWEVPQFQPSSQPHSPRFNHDYFERRSSSSSSRPSSVAQHRT
ncbi:kinase-like domain-containing protein [Abortiporus biennis]|nr:kinase-like domain-containing protein [Abortiporus biennis]